MSPATLTRRGSRQAVIDGEQLLTDLVSIESPSGREGVLAGHVAHVMEDAGFDVHVDDAGNVVGAWGSGAETVALVGHLDTAPGRIHVRREARKLYGRGTVDAKGPLAAAITAVSSLPRAGSRRYVVIGAVEEEATSFGAHHLANTMDVPSSLVILEPSGWDAITIGYKGSMRVQWERAQAAGHGAGPEPSAADHGFAFVRRVQDYASSINDVTGIFDRLDVRVLRCEAGTDGLSEHASLELGLRIPPRCDGAALRETLNELATDGEVSVLYADDAVRTDRSSPLARDFVNAVRAHGGAPRFKLKTGTSDMNILVPRWGCPAVAYGPGNSRLDHTPDEHIDLDELDRAVRVLQQALRAQ